MNLNVPQDFVDNRLVPHLENLLIGGESGSGKLEVDGIVGLILQHL